VRLVAAALLLACTAATVLAAEEHPKAIFPVEWDAPEPLRSQLAKLLPPPATEPGARRGAVLRPWVRDVRRRVPEIAAAEGYFSATVEVDFEDDRESAKVTVVLGPRTTVSSVDIEFAGDIAGEGEERALRRRQLREAWLLGAGSFFRSGDWEEAKRALREKLIEEDYAAGDITQSMAEVDADAARARLRSSSIADRASRSARPSSPASRTIPGGRPERRGHPAGGTLPAGAPPRAAALDPERPVVSSVVVEIDRDAQNPTRCRCGSS
jgi:translocation and assembly module TamA